MEVFFFFTFDIGLVVIVILMFILAIINSLAPLLPFFVVLLWVVYGVSAATMAFLAIGLPDKIHRKLISIVYNGVAYYFIFALLQDYIHSIQRAGAMAGINGAIEFALATLFGGVPMFGISLALMFGGLQLSCEEDTWKYCTTLVFAGLGLFIVYKIFF